MLAFYYPILSPFILLRASLESLKYSWQKRKAVLIFLIGLISLINSHKTIAQTEVSFKVHASSSAVTENETFEVFYTLENATGEEFSPPDFQNFEVLSGPNYSSSVQFINGVVYKKEEYSFVLRPTKVGRFNIGSARIKIAEKRIRSNDLQVQVTKGTRLEKKENDELFVRIEPSSKIIYLGEQLVLNYKVYTRVNIERYSFEKEATYNGFYSEEIERFFSPTSSETINGETYTTKTIRRLALFPLQTGTHTIEESALNFLISESRGFLFNRNIKNIKRVTDPIEIKVKPLPDGAPPSFSGAVGQFNFNASIDNTLTEVGKGIKMRYVISGNGDPKRTQPPQLMSNDTFEFYEPKIVSDDIDDRSRDQFKQKLEIEYTVIPKMEGTFTFTPEFTYYDTDADKYSTILGSPFNISVRPSTTVSLNSHFSADSSKQLIALKAISTFGAHDQFYGSVIFWILFFLPIVLFMLFEFTKKLQQNSKITSTNHQDELQDFLNKIDKISNQGNAFNKENLGKLNEYFRHYLRGKFNLTNNFSSVELENALNESSIDSELRNSVVQLFQRIEFGTYSQSATNIDIQSLIDKSTEITNKLD